MRVRGVKLKKFIVIVEEELIIVKARDYNELNGILAEEEENFIIFNYEDTKTCTKLKLIDGELFDLNEETEDNSVEGVYPLRQITYSIHKKNGEKMLKASYNFKTDKGWVWTSKYLCFDKSGYAKEKAYEWLNERLSPKDCKSVIDTESALKMKEYFEKPRLVEAGMNDAGYPVITDEIW